MDSEQAGAVTMESPSRVAQWLMPGWKRALKTISMLGAATAIGAVCVFLTQTLLARELGPDDYGLFASSLATVTMIAPLAGFGLAQFRLRVYGVEGWAARRWIAPSLRFTVGTCALAIAIIAGWALFVAPDADTRYDLLVLIPIVLHILTIEMLSTKYRLEDRYARMAGWQLAIPVSRLLVALALLLVPQLTGRFVATSYAVISLAMVLWALPLLRSVMRGEIDLRGHGPEPSAHARVQEPRVSELWSQAWPFGMVAILYPVFFQVSTILLKYLGSDKQAGFWAIGLAVMTAIYLIPATIYQKFLLSKLHRWAAHDPMKFWMVYKRGNVGMFALGVLVAATLAVASPFVIPLVFGEAYRGVVAILLVLSLCPPIRFLSTAMGSALLTDSHMRYRVYAMAWATGVAILLNGALIPDFGVMGAAWATVTAELVLLAGTWYGVRHFRRAKGVHP
ncbi:Membrane protein [Lysobacter dokdonensis DS-58]|uniref:Membrane protein n=1 Tax=Lysobacter dokdonensis DS-58 TaxID=1300345 RepID=A0A0A2WM76_9GAMM|nr:polysaccharide biosynthesis C-terminal domain-containing protein [Lysobacter dokdonensis]KGQ19837.1 Membrane protein [Lysobacter dokdonensis DS-58]